MLNFCRNVVSVILVVVIVVVVTLIFDQAGIIGASPPPAVQPAPVYILPTPIIPTPVPTIAPTAVPTTVPTAVPAQPPTRLVSAALGLDVAVVSSPSIQLPEGTEPANVPAATAAWWSDSGTPGHFGNVVVYGHNYTAFAPLAGVQIGQEFELHTTTAVYRYVVTDIVVVAEEGQPVEKRQENGRYIRPFDDERLTLVTCWPFPSGTSHRFIVIAKRS